jgi:hypothetical protein
VSRWPDVKAKLETFHRIGYLPNPTQFKIHRSAATVLQIVGAEGGGKSYVTAGEVAACVPWSNLIYLVGQTYDNAHAEFDYLVESLSGLNAVEPGQVSQPKHGVWQMTTRTGCHIITLSVERGAAAVIAKGQQPDIIVLCEGGRINSESVLFAATRRVTRMHGRVILAGTLWDNHGWYAKMVDTLKKPGNAWQGETFSLPAWTNTYLYPGGRDDPEILRLEKILPPDEFARTVAAERLPGKALVFGNTFDYDVHFADVPYQEDKKVTLWVDPGYFPSVYAVLAVQFAGDGVRHFDEVYLNHHTHEEMIEVCRGREWWGNVERIVIDIAGKKHTAENPMSAIEVWSSLARVMPVYQLVGVMEGVERHRSILHQCRIIHDYGCTGTQSEYNNYVVPTDRDGNPTRDMPKDYHNHAMKAIAYGLIDKFGFTEVETMEVKTYRRDVIKEIEQEGAWA